MPTDPSAAELLDRVQERYATARSYRDTGESTVVLKSADFGSLTSVRPFKTAFMRPDRFRFEFRSQSAPMPGAKWNLGVVWMNHDGVQRWWGVEPSNRERPRDLDHAIGGFTGVSGGTASAVPRLLGLGSAQPPLPAGDASRVIGRDGDGDRDCFVVEGLLAMGGIVRVWIEASTLALVREDRTRRFDAASHAQQVRRLEAEIERTKSDPRARGSLERSLEHMRGMQPREFESESTIRWHPEFDIEIDDAAFEFTPPG